MSNILGSIIVQLKANVAEYVSGMGSAAYASRHASKEIRESFEGLGGVLSTVLAPFGAIGEHIAETFSKVGQFSGAAAANLGKLGGAMGVVGAAGGVAVGALAAIEAGAVGLAVHTAESIAQLHVLSQQTQVSTEALSGLGYVAKQSGVGQEQLSKGLEKLNKAIFAAATAAPGTINAFTRLGVSVRDSSGEIRSTESIFGDLAAKFAGFEGPAKGALAMQLFGKAGAELIPVLNQGRSGIASFLEEARSFGLIIDGQTAEAAHAFEQNLNRLKAAGEGLSISLTRQLLPVLQTVSNALVEGFKDKSSSLNDFISAVVYLTKVTVAVGETFGTFFASIGRGVGAGLAQFEELGAGLKAIAKAPDPSSLVAAYKESRDRLKAIDDLFLSNNRKAWQDNANFINNLFGPRAPFTLPPPPATTSKVDTSTKDATDSLANSIKRTVDALREQADAQIKLASATGQTIAAQKLQVAANEASAIITKLTDEAESKTGHQRAAGLALIQRETKEIYALTAAKVLLAEVVSINTELEKETRSYDEQISSLQALADAYQVGGSAIAEAQIGAKLAKDKDKVQDTVDVYETLRNQVDQTGPAITAAAIAALNANKALAEHDVQLHRIQATDIAATINKSENAFREETPALLALNQAYFQNAEAVRQAQVQQQVAQFRVEHPGAEADEIARIGAIYDKQSKNVRDNALAKQAASLDIIQSYKEEISNLETLGAIIEANGHTTIEVDAAIYDAQTKVLRQWDEAVLKIGTLTQKTQAFLNELKLQGQNLGQSIFGEFTKGLEGLEDQLAKLLVTGQANFKQLFQSVAEGIAKAGIQKLVSAAAGAISSKIGGGIPGIGKPDGSSPNLALYVRLADSDGKQDRSGIGEEKARGSSPFGESGLDKLPLTNQNANPFGESGLDNLPFINENKGFGSSPFGSSGLDNLPLTNTNSGASGSGDDGLISKLGESLGGIFSKIGDSITSVISKITGVISSIASTIGSIISGIAGGIGSAVKGIAGIFGGFLAGGGDVTPGKAYVVGEKHPEVFVPHKAGQVTPALRTPESIAGLLGRARSSDTKGQAYVVGQKRPQIFIAREHGQITPALKRPDTFTPIQRQPAARSTTATSLPIAALPNITFPPSVQLPTAAGPRPTSSSPIAAIESSIFVQQKPADVQAARIRTPESKPSEKRPDLFVTYNTEQLLPIPKELRIAPPPAITIPAASAARSTNPAAGIFGGFLAAGGDVTPGKTYIVGENKPEFFTPKQAGRVTPELPSGGMTQQNEYNFHFHGVQDMDSFKKSRTQLYADMQLQLAAAHGRNRS